MPSMLLGLPGLDRTKLSPEHGQLLDDLRLCDALYIMRDVTPDDIQQGIHIQNERYENAHTAHEKASTRLRHFQIKLDCIQELGVCIKAREDVSLASSNLRDNDTPIGGKANLADAERPESNAVTLASETLSFLGEKMEAIRMAGVQTGRDAIVTMMNTDVEKLKQQVEEISKIVDNHKAVMEHAKKNMKQLGLMRTAKEALDAFELDTTRSLVDWLHSPRNTT